MPHVGGGGGSSSGGFHSGGSSSSTPKYDKHGRIHSSFYILPGFYYNRTYIPLEKNKRKNIFVAPTILFVIGILLTAVLFFAIFSKPKYDEDTLADYSIKKYSEVYNKKDKNYEHNLLVMIVGYDNGDGFDYITIVGDEVSIEIDKMFGNEKTTFGRLVKDNVNSDDYFDDLYSKIAYCIENVNTDITKKYYNYNSYDSKIVNNTTYIKENNKMELETKMKEFYDKTGYNISLYVDSYDVVYKLSLFAKIALAFIPLLVYTFAIVLFVNNYKALKKIEKAEKEGTEKMYFEGEDDYETYIN